ncbi:MAG TPA: hypothetical protein VJS65_00450 [Verrucomicrobiae bacterium]|nr:hypothetical protein [Verrucomicrobiae bacterium]
MAALEAAAAIHTLSHNASTAVALDDDYMVVGDDEDQVLRIYHRRIDGPPVYTRDFRASLGLTDVSPSGQVREVDIEASVRVGNRIYWMGSHGNCGGCDPPGELRPNRLRIFATDIVQTGTNYSLKYVGRYHFLRRDLINWDNNNGHGLGPSALQLAASAAEGVPPETATRDGFNIEGLTMSHTGTVAYIGFRSPLTPGSGRTNALIVPLLNLPQLVAGNPAPGPARFGKPIELFLDRRGIRSIDAVSNGYVIVAGTTTNSGSFRIYTWNGNTNQVPVERQSSFSVNQPEGLIVNGPIATGSQVQLISEGGDDFSSEYVTIGHGIPELRNTLMAQGAFHFLVIGTPGGSYDIETSQNGGPWTYSATIGVPQNGQANWTDFGAAATHRRLYRLRYPSR